ncbi:MFS transporter [Frankia sp. R82]|uniref:MFS transporter n=1 Tax=Frankia sp. R82 TaxID=2950553 RepID=UPI0020449648|nr:MFS transporter [Frankia sp. R82]MCM3882321.1 MFS transporter [Frankia sp. R82]
MPEAEVVHAAHTRRWLALVAVLTSQLVIILDGNVLNVALPAIQEDLGISQAKLTWVVNAYLISYGSLLLVTGRLGDLIGRKVVFLAGMATFTAASAACGLASSQEILIAARFTQGIGGALASAAALAFIVTDFPAGAERGRAMNYYMIITVGGGSIGLLLGGLLTQVLSWHWIFAINIPIGLASLVAGLRLIPSRPGTGTGGLDVLGAVMVTAAAIIGITGIVGAADHGWFSTRTLLAVGVAVALLAAFVGWESRVANPIVPPRILRQRALVGSAVVRSAAIGGVFAVFFFGTLFLQRVLHYNAIETGLAFLPQSIVIMLLSLGVTTGLMTRLGARAVLVIGLMLLIGSLVLLGWSEGYSSGGYFPWPFIGLLGVGLGAGLTFLPLLTIAMKDVPPADAGLASGIVNVTMQISGAVALAILGTLANNRTENLVASGHDPLWAFASGSAFGMFVGAGFVVFALLLSFVLLRPGRLNPAASPVHRPDETALDGLALDGLALDGLALDGVPGTERTVLDGTAPNEVASEAPVAIPAQQPSIADHDLPAKD